MKYKVTLNNRTYEIEVEKGDAILLDEYEACAPVAPAPAPVAAAPAPAPVAAAPAPAPVAAAPAPAPVAAAPAPAPVAAAGEKVTSPLPGTVVAVKASVGEQVKKGQTLVVIEAMKMENEIVAPTDGNVVQIAVKSGDNVDSGSLLAVLG